MADKELKGDMSKLQAALDKALKDSENYTARTWRVYSNAVSAIETAMENADNTSVADVAKITCRFRGGKISACIQSVCNGRMYARSAGRK